MPERTTNPIFLVGIFLNAFTANGNKIKPADNILKVATWYGVNAFKPSFIKINELPQIMERSEKTSQLAHLLNIQLNFTQRWLILT